MLLRELRQSIDQDSWCNNVQSLDETGVAPMTETGADLAFYKGGCPIHLKGAPPPNYFDPCYRNQTIFLALEDIVGARRSYDI